MVSFVEPDPDLFGSNAKAEPDPGGGGGGPKIIFGPDPDFAQDLKLLRK
jgi:hypothetical protein